MGAVVSNPTITYGLRPSVIMGHPCSLKGGDAFFYDQAVYVYVEGEA
jgi:hypothetical protein